MMQQRLGVSLCLALGLFQGACGKKDKSDDVNVKDLQWVDENSTLRPVSSLALQGEVLGNVDMVVTFHITDAAGKEVKLSENTLQVVGNKPPSGKLSLSLQEDMETQVEAGQDVCNGDYTLNVVVTGGSAKTSKPLSFKVVDGRDSCTQTSSSALRRGAVYNVQGKDKGAFDLVNGRAVGVKESSDSKDLLDLTVAGRAWRMTLGSGNGAQFLAVGHVFDTITEAEAEAAFQSGSSKSETAILSGGETYLVRLASARSSAWYVIKITNIDKNSGSSRQAHNRGVIEFTYRKLSQGKVS